MEILNIEYNIGKLVLKALNRTRRIDDAAAVLGVCARQVFIYKRHYSIYWSNDKEAFVFDATSIMHKFKKARANP